MKQLEVYKITNNINGKVYVGITNRGYKTRWYKHCSDAIRDSDFPIHNAIRKYGSDNFTIEVIEKCNNQEILKKREKYWIKELNSKTTGEGYNLTDGGDGTFGRFHSEETKDKIRQKAIGRKVTESTKLIIRLKSPTSKKISQFDLEGNYIKTFRSSSEAGRQLGFERSFLSSCARGKVKQAYGYKWLYTDRLPEDPDPIIIREIKPKAPKEPMSDEIKRRISETNKLRWTKERRINASKNNHKNRVIMQYSINDEFIKEFPSVADAVKEVGASTHTNIAKCARGIRKSSCGYIWKYKE